MINKLQQGAGMVKSANDMRKQQAKFQTLMDEVKVTGTSKNGKVNVTINGSQKILDIQIDPALVTFVAENLIAQGKEDNMMKKAIMEAIDDAISNVQTAVVKKIQESGNMGELTEMLQSASGMMGGQ